MRRHLLSAVLDEGRVRGHDGGAPLFNSDEPLMRFSTSTALKRISSTPRALSLLAHRLGRGITCIGPVLSGKNAILLAQVTRRMAA
jgi:hypothetical protein